MLERDIDFIIGAVVFVSVFVLPEVLKFFAPQKPRRRTAISLARKGSSRTINEPRVVFPNFLVALFSNPMFNISLLLFIFTVFFGLTAYQMNIHAYIYEGIAQMNSITFFTIYMSGFLVFIVLMASFSDYLYVKRGGAL